VAEQAKGRRAARGAAAGRSSTVRSAAAALGREPGDATNGGPAASGTATAPEALRAALGRDVSVSGGPDEIIVGVSRDELGPAVQALTELGARHIMLLGLDLRGLDPGAALAVEEVLSLSGGLLVRLRADLSAEGASYPSLTSLLPAAQWDEREVRDLFGVVPTGHPDPRPLVIHDAAIGPAHPLLKVPPAVPQPARAPFRAFAAQGEGVYQLPVGPIHAGIIEPGHFRFSAVGESVLHLDARLFYAHRGLEKLAEGRSFDGALLVLERACGVCTVTHAAAFSRAVERLTGTVIPPRARLARILLAELERLYNHVGDLGNICAGVGFHFGTSSLGWQKERLLRLNEALTGHRYLTGVVAPGGLRLDVDGGGLAQLGASVREIDHDVRSIVRLLVRSESFIGRLHGTGVVRGEDARRLGAVGVAARASGLPIDLRSERPSDGYEDLEVPLITQAAGDVAARFHVRAQEAVVSAGLIRDLSSRLPDGPIRAPLARLPEPGASTVAGAEGPRGASWAWLMAGADGRVERLHLRSGSFANWPVVAAAAPGNLVPDFPLINKSFELCYACTDR
jgi:Ni,Fe-hydrogenase III large subunit/Ni,Fe-hydrogenase III component G